jgi:AsmA-like C-terminal region
MVTKSGGEIDVIISLLRSFIPSLQVDSTFMALAVRRRLRPATCSKSHNVSRKWENVEKLADQKSVVNGPRANREPRSKKWLLVASVVALIVVIAMAAWAPGLSSVARSKIQSTLEDRFASDLQIENLKVSLFPSVSISGESVVFRQKGRPNAQPLIEIAKFTANGSILGLLVRHVHSARLEGLRIHVPPKDTSQPKGSARSKTPYFVVDEIIADGTTVSTMPRDSWKDPLVFSIKTLRMHGASSTSSLSFEAVLTNPKPPGEINSKGRFGPWNKEQPSDTPVSGNYTFREADLGVFKGISGTLSSDGTYRGALGRIEVSGHTDVPEFALSIAGNPVHLITDYEAIVDGTSGNTYLHPVTARFGNSTIVANGSVEGKQGVVGKTVSLDTAVTDGRLEDILRLAVHASTPPLTGEINFHAKIVIPPGNLDVVRKLKLDGAFVVGSAQFSQLNVQRKIDELSHRGKGNSDDADAPTVASDFRGNFSLDGGVLGLRDLSFNVPGIAIELNGKYGLENQSMDFRGTAKLDAKLSQTTTGFKSVLLKAVDPLFKKKGSSAGAVIPFRIFGTRDKPSFGLDLAHHGH